MNAARAVRVVLSGEDKAEAVLAGISRSKSVFDFPGCGVAKALWMIDTPAAKLLASHDIVHSNNYVKL